MNTQGPTSSKSCQRLIPPSLCPSPPPSPTPGHSALQPRRRGHEHTRADVVKVLRVLQVRHVTKVEGVALVENLVV